MLRERLDCYELAVSYRCCFHVCKTIVEVCVYLAAQSLRGYAIPSANTANTAATIDDAMPLAPDPSLSSALSSLSLVISESYTVRLLTSCTGLSVPSNQSEPFLESSGV